MPEGERFNMAVMGLRLAARANGVAQPARRGQPRDVPAAVARRAGRRGADRFDHQRRPRAHLGLAGDGRPARPARPPALGRGGRRDWARIEDATDDEIWRVREQGKDRLVAFVRDRIRRSAWPAASPRRDVGLGRRGARSRALTIGFARRFATYKRATLLLSQPDRLRALLLDHRSPGAVRVRRQGPSGRRPRQGDDPPDRGASPATRGPAPVRVPRRLRHRRRPGHVPRVRRLVEHPRRPQEACGTSGMKAALNGAAQLLDPRRLVGRVLRRRERLGHLLGRVRRRRRPAGRAGGQHPVRPARAAGRPAATTTATRAGFPDAGSGGSRHALAVLGPFVTASRMVKDYATELYEPAAAHVDRMSADQYRRSRQLADWKERVIEAWHGVHVDSIESDELHHGHRRRALGRRHRVARHPHRRGRGGPAGPRHRRAGR